MPPIDFGIVWTDRGIHRRYGHDLRLFTGPDPLSAPLAFSYAWRANRAALEAAGFTWTSKLDGGFVQICWWEIADAATIDAVALQAIVDNAFAVAEAARVAKEQTELARWNRELAEHAERAEPIRAELGRLLRDHPWQLGRSLAEAREILAKPDWGASAVDWTGRYVRSAKANADRAEARLAKPTKAVWFARAACPDVRVAAHQATRYISALDADWAAERNGRGWSMATCWAGHTLSDKAALDQAEAAHALELLYGHRGQLTDEMAIGCFGAAPVRRKARRPVADPGLLLASA